MGTFQSGSIRSQKKSTKRFTKKTVFSLALVIVLWVVFSGSALAGGVGITGVNDSSTFYVPRSLDTDPVTIDDDVTISGSASFADGYLYIKPSSSSADDRIAVKSDANPNAYNAISISGSTVYVGTGSGKKAIGSIDGTLNGENGKGLKINFSTPLPNGGFEEGYETWTFHNDRYNMSGDSGLKSGTKYGFLNMFTAYEYYRTAVKSYGAVEGSKYLYLSIDGVVKANGTQHGPWVESAAFSAKKGDSISLYFSAKNTGDKYDVYGYLVDKDTGAKQLLFYERGDSTGGWKQVTSKITLPSSDNYSFQFICGSQDGTGGTIISSELLVDGVKIIKNEVNSSIVTNIARKVQFVRANTGSNRPSSTRERSYTFEVKDSQGVVTTASGATVKVHTWPETPSVSAAPAGGTTDTLNISYSSALASSYDVYLDGALEKNDVATTSASFGGLGVNTSHTIRVISSNDMGASDAGTVTKYTHALGVSIVDASSTTDSVELTIDNNGNPAGTAYCLERSANGSGGWAVVRDFNVLSSSGETTVATDSLNLAPNTLYYYRMKARNGDGVQTGYSDVFSWYTGPAAPNPVTATPRPTTADTLDISWGSPQGAVNYDVFIDGTLLEERLSANTISATGLEPNTAHDIKVLARNATEGTSRFSSTVTKYTNAAVPTLQMDSATTQMIFMTIQNNGNPEETQYLLQRSIDGVNYTTLENFTIDSTEEETTPYIDRNLHPGTVYYYRIKARNEDGVGTAYSEAVSKITKTVAPTGVTVNARNGVAADLIISWTAPYGASSFDVYRKAQGEDEFTKTASAVEETSIEQLGLTPNRNYIYYIVAKNASGASVASSAAGAYTNAMIPGIVSENSGDTNNLTIQNKGNPTSLSPENSAGTEYYIEYTTDAEDVVDKTWTPLSGNWITYLSPQHSGIDSGATYSYRVKARNSIGVETTFSDLASARSNDAPVVTIDTPSSNTYRSNISGHTYFLLSGMVSDADGDIVTLQSTIDGVQKSVTVRATAAGVPWTLSWDVADDTLAESNYSDIAVEAMDDYSGYTLKSWTYMLTVDKTQPQAPVISAETDWTNATFVPVTITNGTDLGSGADRTQYSLSGATELGWTVYTPFSITNEGITTIHARTVDKVGNIGPEQTLEVKIDRTAPDTPSFSLESTAGDSGYTSNTLMNIKGISATDPSPGAGNGDGVMTPKEMMISNAADFDGAVWEAFSASSAWALATADNGTHTVYIRCRDAVGNVSAVAQEEIVLDDTPPVISISQPSSFNTKKGATVTYIISLDEACHVDGMDNSENSNIELTFAGDFPGADKETIWNALTFEQVDTTHYLVHINLPDSIASNGMIGMKILAGLATDDLGNASIETPANASFAIDAEAPDNQDDLFTASLTVSGGEAVTLAKTSQGCDGGFDSDSVRFAPSGYTGEEPADAVTITSTHGRSSVINAPTQEGNYYLYIIDAAGNISARSTHMLTVKNDGPSVTVSGDAAWVRASASVDYLVTYSVDTDADTINLKQQNISLVTTGTANAYVTISSVPGELYQRKVTLTNLMGDGTIAIKVAAGTAKDTYNNPALASNISELVTVDNIAPVVTTQGLVSDNGSDTAYAKVGDQLTLDFTTNEEVDTPVVTIQGEDVTPVAMNAQKTSWRAQITVTAGEPFESAEDSEATFGITACDKVNNESETVTQADAGGNVTYDFHAPVVTIEGEQGLDLDALGKYKEGVVVTFNEGEAVVNGGSSIDSGTVVYDAGVHTVVVTDAAGQTASLSFEICYDSIVIADDKEALDIGYAEGDSADSVTRDVTLPETTESGAAVSWASDNGAVDAVTGTVTRPAAGAGDTEVILTATITKNGYTETKTFHLNVVESPESPDGLEAVTDDANKAKIYYAYGDSAQSVTQDMELGSVGLLNGSVITWTSSDPDTVFISDIADGENVYNASVTQPEKGAADKEVTLTATAADPDDPTKKAAATFIISVKAIVNTPAQNVQEDYNDVDIAFADGDDAQSVTQDITLLADVTNGSTVTWQSSVPEIISNTGEVTRPTAQQGSSDVNVTATISSGDAKVTKVFSLRVIAAPHTAASDVDADKAALAIGYFEGDNADSVTTHVVLPTIGAYGSAISWVSDHTGVIAADGTVLRQSTDTTVNLTATISKDAIQETKAFTLTVKATSEDDILKQIKEDTDRLAIYYARGDSGDAVTDDLYLRTKGANGCDIKWMSGSTDVVSDAGQVNAPADDTQVVLTAYVYKYSDTIGYNINRPATFTVNVISDAVASIDINADFDNVQIGYAKGDSAQSVTAAMYFAAKGKTGTTIAWESDNTGYVSNTGLVTRPSPDEGDKMITIRATVKNPVTGETKTKVFEIKVKKLSDQEAVAGAARALTINDAIAFSEGDYWESVTSSFWVLMTGKNDTNITWRTNSPAIVELGSFGNDGRQVAKINRPANEDKSVILTATISKGSYSVKKTFLLVIKNKNEEKTATREVTMRTIAATLGGGEDSQDFELMRTRLTGGARTTQVDTVVLDSEKMNDLTSKIDPEAPQSQRQVKVIFANDGDDPADEQTLEVPADVVTMLSDKNAGLQVDAGDTQIVLGADGLKTLADQGTDLYLRIVPLTEEQKQAQVAAQAQAQAEGAEMVGIPYVIETNYVGIETTVILPITGEISHPDNVRVYINHSDGTVEILDGTVVYTNGEPSGIKITINHFSTFQVMELPADDDNSDVEETDDNTGVDSSKDTNDEKSHDQNEEEETEDLAQPADTDVSAADTQQDSGNEKMTEPIGQDAADVVWEEDLIEKDGKYYVLVDTVIGKSLVLVCGAQDMPSGTQSEIKAAIMERFGKDIKMPDGDFTLADLAALILQELSEAHTIVSR